MHNLVDCTILSLNCIHLGYGNISLPQIDCYDHDDDGGHDLIGSFTTTAVFLMEARQEVETTFRP